MPKNISFLSPNLQQKMQAAIELQRDNCHDKAIDIYKELMTAYPEFADAFHFGGLAAHALGRDEEAREWLLTAEQLAPEQDNFLRNTSRFFQEIGEDEEARKRAARAYCISPQDPRTVFQYADTLCKIDRGDEVISALERLVRTCPADTGVWFLLANCQLQGGQREQARISFEKACQGTHEAVLARLRFAEVLSESNDVNAAREQFSAIVRDGTPSQRASAEHGLAELAAQLGDKRMARQHAERALLADPQSPFAWLMRVRASDDSELEAIKEDLESARNYIHSDDAHLVDFALGNLLERQGDYPAAWEAYMRANQARRLMVNYDPAEDVHFFDNMKRCLNSDFLSRHTQAANPTRLPIFIVGMPRSGTTLVERALGGHPAVHEGGEMRVLGDILRRRAGPKSRHNLPVWLAQCATEEIKALGDEWLTALEHESHGADRVTDKLPVNFAYIGLIKTCFPNAIVVNLKRDPRDILVSSWVGAYGAGLRYSYDLNDFKTYYSGYQNIMEHWAQIENRQMFIEIEYRQLVEDFEKSITKILHTTGLEWHPNCAQFSNRPGNVATASLFQVRRPLYSSSIGRWKRFCKQLGPLADPDAWEPERT